MDNELMILDIPGDLFQKTWAFTLDIGESLIKTAYTSDVDDKIRVHFGTTPREKHGEAFSMLAEKCSGKLDPDTEVFACGTGGNEFQDRASNQLNAKLTVTDEIGRLTAGFMFLSRHTTRDNFIKPGATEAVAQGAAMASFHEMFASFIPPGNFKTASFTELDKYREGGDTDAGTSVEFPCLIMSVGTTDVIIKVNDDGTYEVCDMEPVGGGTFEGLGSIITGGKSFSELCELASRGNSRAVDVHLDGLEVNPDDKVYGRLKELDNDALSLKVYAFGHAAGNNERDDFKTQDISMALLSMFAETFAARAYMWATIHKVKQVFFVGGFPCANQVIQDEIEKFFALKKFMSTAGHACDCYFLTYGRYCSALGALLMNLGIK